MASGLSSLWYCRCSLYNYWNTYGYCWNYIPNCQPEQHDTILRVDFINRWRGIGDNWGSSACCRFVRRNS